MDYFTQDEKDRLVQQLKECTSKRKTITIRIDEARQLGDLKENAEYHAAREDAGLNEAKIRELERRLANSVVMSEGDAPDDMVFIGATVRLREVGSGDEDLYRLVGESTGNFDEDVIEVTPNSPMGEGLMKARIGETVRVNLRRGPKHYEIVEII